MSEIGIEFEAPRGSRMLGYGFLGITVDWADGALWWDRNQREWMTDDVMRVRRRGGSSTAPCRSYKAFLRHLRKHSGALQGRKVHLVSRWVGYDVTATPTTETDQLGGVGV